jgi:hypothetical protein
MVMITRVSASFELKGIAGPIKTGIAKTMFDVMVVPHCRLLAVMRATKLQLLSDDE